MHLLDNNVWLALVFDAHLHHLPAKAWIDGLPTDEVCYFCRYTQQGFLRLATNPRVSGAATLTLPDAWQKYDAMLTDGRIGFAQEPVYLEKHWRNFTLRQSFSPKIWNDAYLAAFAIAANLEVVTFDQGFKQFAGLKYTILP